MSVSSSRRLRVRRVVTTRAGGRSAAPYDSFNLGAHVGDEPAAVAANRRRLAEGVGLPTDAVVWMDQVHGTRVAVVCQPQAGAVPETDGLLTASHGLAVSVVVADCVPVLLADPLAGVVAAVHAGRLGARDGVLPAALQAMVGLGADPGRVEVVLGPAVCGGCYEVPADMRAEVDAALPGSGCTTRAGTPGLDLRAGLWRQLAVAGVARVAVDPRCTFEDRELFSHRRQRPTGRLAALTWVDDSS